MMGTRGVRSNQHRMRGFAQKSGSWSDRNRANSSRIRCLAEPTEMEPDLLFRRGWRQENNNNGEAESPDESPQDAFFN